MKKKGKRSSVSVDFTGVEAGGGGRLLPEERFQFEVVEAEVKEGEDSGKEYVALKLKVSDGEYEGTTAYDNLSLQPQALWKLRGFMEAAGLATEDGKMDIDLEEFVGLNVMGDIVHEDYRGKSKHRINGYASIDEDGKGDGGSKDEPKGPRKKSSSQDDEPEWTKKMKVSFKEGKKTLEGVITDIDGDKVTVRVGKDEYEMETSDLTAI